MPELPEVETIKRDLENKIIGHKITDFITYWPKMIKGTDSNIFSKKITGKKIIGVERRAKNIIIRLSGDKNLLLHMKMTGHLIYTSNKNKVDLNGRWENAEKTNLFDPYNQCIRAIFSLDNNFILAFSDLRKFGYIKLLTNKEIEKELSKYGPEPFSKKFNLDYLKMIFANKNIAIKKVITDQKMIAGIGNIYADEILWDANIHPEKIAKSLSLKEIDGFIKSSKKILEKSIKMRGTSTSDFRDTSGEKGKFGNYLNAYKKTGKKCSKDNGVIERIVVGGRGTHYCPIHQTLEGK